MSSSKDIALRIIALRKLKGWTQKELAERSGVGIQTIRNIESGKDWSSSVMDKINNALDKAVY